MEGTRDPLYQEASSALMDLAVNLGILGSVMGLPQYEDAQLGWNERLRETRDWARRQIEEIHEFAQSYD